MTQFRELWGRPDAEGLKAGSGYMEKARAIIAMPTPITSREQAYIDALGDFYSMAPQGFQHAADAYVASMAGLHAAYPQDIEGAAFYALSLIADVAPDDTSLTKEHAALAILMPLFHKYPDHPGLAHYIIHTCDTPALAILMPLFHKYPDHPGLAHYIIHTCDTPALAPEGLEAAKVYAKIAPSSPHALHMPGHIFARLGMWPEDISSNLASVAASQKDEAEHQPGVAHQLHADEFLIYAYLQTGQDTKAKNLTDQMGPLGKHVASLPGDDDMKHSGVSFENELNAIYPMEMHDWKALAVLTPAPGTSKMPGFSAFNVYWGQGVAAGHLHDAKLATQALAGYNQVLDRLKKSPYADQANGAQIQRNEILAWQDFANDRPDAAIQAMRMAADQQDKLGQGEVDIPAREMLGDLLLALKHPQQALAEYKVSLKLSPNRLNGLLGAGAAAEATGDDADARSFYEQVARNTDDGAHTNRPSVEHAIQFNATHSTVAGIATP